MKIYSKFKDYYDGLQNFGGSDSNVVYLREQKILLNQKIEKLDILSNDLFLQKGGDRALDKIQIMLFGFCGRIFPLYWSHYYDSWSIAFSLDLPSLAQDLSDNWIKEQKTSRFVFMDSINQMKKIVNEGERFSFDNHYFDIGPFLDFKSPIFLYSSCGIRRYLQEEMNLIGKYDGILSIPTVVTNFCLKTVNFHKFLDQFQAFQEIEQFLGNTLVKREEIVEPSDEMKRELHGFDTLSFKSIAPGKKAQRKANKLRK
jgi:hypothetical protein